MKTVSQVKGSVSGLLTGINLNSTSNINTALERAVRVMMSKCYVPDSMGKTSLTLYDGVYDYTSPTTIFGTQVIDLAPQGLTRDFTDWAYKQNVADFDRTKGFTPSGSKVSFTYKEGTPILRIASNIPASRAVLDGMNDKDVWTAAGSAGTIAEDETVFYDTAPSLRVTFTGASSGTLTQAITRQDLSVYEDVGVAFLAIRTPSVANLTSIALKLGSSASAYDSVSTTTGFLGAWTTGDWILVALDFSGSSSTGTPDWSAIDYAQITVTHAGTLTNFYFGGLWIARPTPATLYYQTPSIFLVSGGSPSSTIRNDNDTVLLNDSALVIYEFESAKSVALQESGGVYTQMVKGLDQELMVLYDTYRANNPSDTLRTTSNWYE